MSDRDGKPSRVSIQLGKASSSSGLDIKKRSRPAHSRRHWAGRPAEDSASGEDSDNDQETDGRVETITSIDLPGFEVEDERSSKCRSVARGSRRENGDTSNGKDRRRDDELREHDEPEKKPIKYGLTINPKGDRSSEDRRKRDSSDRDDRSDSERETKKERKPPKSLDEAAVEALMDSRPAKRKHTDSDAPDREPGPEDYRAIPIDDFGAHLLRNFGWDGKMRGKVKDVTRRANLAGLGAKDAKGAEELGAWNQKPHKDSRPMRLSDYRKEQEKKRQRLDDRYADSYKQEREREKTRERERGRDR
ncbi:hypothetical protein VTJ04DRAFT_212 [Mycothermus thermophilus]|uniref:uncharacterized protein n=1 Tax=Humicola insolens TaxID=85995 RepID=UPI003743775D